MVLITDLVGWQVTMADGSVLQIRTSGFSDIAAERVFTALMDATPEEQTSLDVVARTPANPLRVDVALARIPLARIDSTVGG